MTSFFRYKKASKKQEANLTDTNTPALQTAESKLQYSLVDKIKAEFLASQRIPKHSFLRNSFFCCYRFQETREYKKMMRKSQSRFAKEMDLQKFLHRQRILVTSLLSLLKGYQSTFVDKFSQLLIRESSDMRQTSSDAELSDWGNQQTEILSKISAGKNCTD